VTTLRKRTLYQFRFKREFKAKNGSHGQGKQKTGKAGQDLIIEIPPGTLVKDADSGQVLTDLIKADQRFVLARGGRGGQGNARFKTSTHRAPRFAQPGEQGESKRLQLELKLLADVGIIGLPNAGKSTLITAVSAANPKIANYPFTTLTPTLGVVQTEWGEPFVVADIPGLIEGAHKGAGLGIRFLKHIERTRILIHLIDAAALDPDDPLHSFHTINNELAQYNHKLAQKPQIVALNKLDLPGTREAADTFTTAAQDMEVVFISALTGQGVDELISQIIQMLDSNQHESRHAIYTE
jgi:GTP-binding protein